MSEMQAVSERARSGVYWVMLTQGVNVVLGFGISVALARLLTPRDFGTVGIATMFFEVSNVVGNFGMAGALIQRRDLAEAHKRVAFLASTTAAAALTLIFLGIAAPASIYFGNPTAAPVMRIMAVSVLLSGMSAVPVALLQRTLSFRRLALLGMLNTGVNGLIAVGLAVAGAGVWSLVWAAVGSAAFYLLAANAFAAYAPRPGYDRQAFASLFGFGGALTVKNILVYLARNLDYFVVGRRLGTEPLGYYTRAFTLMSLPQTQFITHLNRVIFPAFSRIQDDHARIRQWFLGSVRALSCVVAPAFLALAVLADDFTILFYTSKWAGMITALRILCLAGTFRVLYSLGGPIVEATGNVRYELWLGLANAAMVFCGALLGSLRGIEGVACGVLLASIGAYLLRAGLLRRIVDLSLGAYFRAPLGPLACSLGACAAALAAGHLLPAGAGSLPRFAARGAAFALAYALFLFLFARPQFDLLLTEARRWTEPLLPARLKTLGG